MSANYSIKHSSQMSVEIHPNDMVLLDINTLSSLHVIEELIQLPIGSDTVVINSSYWTNSYWTNSYWTKTLA